MSQSTDTDDAHPAELPNRTRPVSTRAADDALPQTPKYKSLDKMYSSNETSAADQPSQREERDRPYVEEEPENLRMCTLVPRHMPQFILPDEFVNAMGNRKVYHLPTSRFIEAIVKPALFHLAKTAAYRKLTFLILPIFLTCIVLVAPFYYWDHMKIATPFSSFISGADPTNLPIKDIRLSSQNLKFNSTRPEFDAIKRSSLTEFSILMTARNNYTNIISNSTLSEYRKLKVEIQNISIAHSFLSLKWDDVCRENCHGENPIIDGLQKGQVILKYPEAILTDDSDLEHEKRIFFANFFGDFDYNIDGIVTRARSMLMSLKLKDNLNGDTYKNFENRLKELIDLKQGKNEMRLYFWSVRNFMKDVIDMLEIVHWRLLASAGILIFYCLIFSIRSGDSYRTRPFVGIQIGVVLTLCAIIGYCVQISAGAGQMNAMAFPVLYVIVVCGILIYFGILQSWNRYSLASLHPVEKLAFIYSWDGPVLVLSLLVVIASSVCVAVFAQLQYTQVCFFILASGVTAVLAFGLFYMTICWFCSGRREAEGLKWYQCGKRGDQVFNEQCIIDYDKQTSLVLHEKLTDLKPSFSRYIGKFATNSKIRTITVICLTAYCIFAYYGYQRLQIQMKEEFFVDSNSTSFLYLQRYRNAFKKYENYLEIVFDSNIDYYDKNQRDAMLDLLTEPVRKHYAIKATSWLLDFDRFQEQSIYDINSETLVPIVNYVFLNDEHNQRYTSDIVFDKFKTQIMKSRSYLELSQKGVNEIQYLVQSLLDKAEQTKLPLSIKTPLIFSLHHDLQVFQKMLISALILLTSSALFTLFFFGQPSMALSVLFSCVFVSIGVVCYSTYLSIPINVTTLNATVIGLCFTILTSIFFCYNFINAGRKQQNSVSRVQYAFQCSLWPTIMACVVLSTLIFPLFLAIDAPVLMHIWKCFIAISVLSFVNLIFVLPNIMIIFTEYISICCGTFNRICTDNGCFGAEQPTESIYFVPANDRHLKMLTAYSNYGVALDGPSRRMILAANAPPEYGIKSSSIMFTSEHLPYSPRNRCHIREADSQANSRPGSTRNVSQHQTPRRERRSRKHEDSDSLANDEQIYEEPESPSLPRTSGANISNIRVRGGLPRDEPYRNHIPTQPWRQYIFENRAYPMSSIPYVSSPQGTRKFM